MALILIDDNKPLVMSPRDAAYLWMIKKGYVQPKNEMWRKRAERTKKIYLNPANAPDDYLAERRASSYDSDEPVKVYTERWIPIETRKDLM